MKRLFTSVVIIVLLLGVIFFAAKAHSLSNKLGETQIKVVKINNNKSAIDFLELFVDDVLMANGEVNFETRVDLEKAVREMNDPAILAQWQKFSQSATEVEAQAEVKTLLSLVVKKIRGTAN